MSRQSSASRLWQVETTPKPALGEKQTGENSANILAAQSSLKGQDSDSSPQRYTGSDNRCLCDFCARTEIYILMNNGFETTWIPFLVIVGVYTAVSLLIGGMQFFNGGPEIQEGEKQS